eukprot:4862318-Karenia_brevis.AAC.1
MVSAHTHPTTEAGGARADMRRAAGLFSPPPCVGRPPRNPMASPLQAGTPAHREAQRKMGLADGDPNPSRALPAD